MTALTRLATWWPELLEALLQELDFLRSATHP